MNIQTEILKVDSSAFDPDLLSIAGERIRRGELVAFPTETVYGLGANALDEEACMRIFIAKGRPATNPLIVHVDRESQLKLVVSEWTEAAKQCAERFWPGPLTLVVPKHKEVPSIVTAGGDTVAVRMPAHPVALGLLRAAGVPIAAPSANASTGVSSTTAKHVLKSLSGKIECVLDGGPTAGGIESTVLDLTSRPRILRPGLISAKEIEEIVGPLDESSSKNMAGPARSPGQSARHYAPTAKVVLVQDGARERVHQLVNEGFSVGWMTFASPPSKSHGAEARSMPLDPTSYARALYATLHDLDDLGVDWILIELPPRAPEWRAIHDRLARAAQRPS